MIMIGCLTLVFVAYYLKRPRPKTRSRGTQTGELSAAEARELHARLDVVEDDLRAYWARREVGLEELRVDAVRDRLRSLDLDTRGSKQECIDRMMRYIRRRRV